MIRLLTISNNDQGLSWGPAVHYLELWNSFVESFGSSYEVTGIVPSWTGLPSIKAPRFRLRMVRVPAIPRARQLLFDVFSSLRILFGREDLVYLRLSSFHLFSMLALTICGKVFFIELNGIAASDAASAQRSGWFRRLTSWQEKWLIRNAALVFAVSGLIGRHAERTGAAGVRVVPNGVSADFFRVENPAYQAGKPTIVYVGTYTSWDGSEEVPELARAFPAVRFLMIGDGARKKAIQEASPANVEFVGAVPYAQLAGHYGKVEAGIVLYEEERHRTVELSSMKVREYLACGLPVFSTDVPGQEFIRENRIGRLCRRENMASEFEAFLENLAVYKGNVERYRRGAGRSHSWEEAARITEKAIREVAGEDV